MSIFGMSLTHIKIYVCRDTYVPLTDADEALLWHLTGGCTGFEKEQLETVTRLAIAHDWTLQIVEQPETEGK